MRIVELNRENQARAMESLLKRSPVNYGEYEQTVRDIIADVRARGDSAVFRGGDAPRGTEYSRLSREAETKQLDYHIS